MGHNAKRAILVLDAQVRSTIEAVAKSRTEGLARVERAQVLLAYADGARVTALAKAFHTNRPKIERILDRALEMGAVASLDDRPGRGRKPRIPPEARAWLLSLACTKPMEFGYPEELWATRTLALHARQHGPEAGHPSLAKLGRGTVSKLLTGAEVRPHKIEYYLERRDPEFEPKMAQVLMVYREVEVLQEKLKASGKAESQEGQLMAVLSLDEKPGIQAIGKVAPDLPPVPGKHKAIGRDYEYKRHGTLSLLAGLDLLTGQVHACIEERHRSLEFTKLLEQIHQAYAPETRILIVLDNHSAHISKETQAYLKTRPNRFEFVFTPKHGSWLNLVEALFAKMTKTLLRGIRVASKAELKDRILQYLQNLNADPVVFRWRYKMDEVKV
nr:IS630 family transposase [uncultured Pseudomonas sp.]